MAKLSEKQKIATIVVCMIAKGILFVAFFGFFIYLTIFHADFGHVYNAYLKYDDEYYSAEITVEKIWQDEKYGTGYLSTTNPRGEGYIICDKTYQMLADSDFFDVVQEGTVITIYTHSYIAWDGWNLPIVGVKVGDKEYVDFQTGKQNWLDWLKMRSEEYGFLQTPIKQQ